MNRPAIACLALTLGLASSAREAASQTGLPPLIVPPATDPDRTGDTPSHPIPRLLAMRPRVIVWPMAALLDDGSSEQRLAARATWPGSDTAPDFALHLLAGLARATASTAIQGSAWTAPCASARPV